MFNKNFIEAEILDQYLYDENATRPWIIGFSGGKDSTILLQLVWNALNKITSQIIKFKRPIYIVCNDTLVENPKIVQFIEKTLKKVQQASLEQGLPFQVIKTNPRLEDTFWINLIGKGYSAPSNVFRWCTERLKIKPTTRFILEQVTNKGEVIILLGTRNDESATRSKSIKKHEIYGQRLRKHVLPNAFVYAPLTEITTNEVWQYLNQVNPPWGGTHKTLITLYRNANSGDCPLVIDESTPSCGNSRFGCWVCTVVKRDKSMEGLIDNGEDWMEPLIDIRDFLVETRDNPEKYREKLLRNGSYNEKKWGPYKKETRVEILRKLLIAQKSINEIENLQLITQQELIAIQHRWLREGINKPFISEIYNEIFNIKLDMSKHEEKYRQEDELLRKSCKQDEKQFELIKDLLAIQKTKTLMLKKRGLQSDIENRINEFVKENEN